MSTCIREDTFRPTVASDWHTVQVGGGHLVVTEGGLRLVVARARHDRYANAQICDYIGLARHQFPWRPPLRLTVRARATPTIAGTAGFGFWNHPSTFLGNWPALPAAIWFFYASPPSAMPLALDVPGHGWKVACIDTTQPSALAWAPLALPVVLLNQSPALYRRIWPVVQRALRIDETSIPPLDERWTTFTLEWYEQTARFAINGATVFMTDRVPRGPLGFVAWVDTQWARVTPQGRIGWGLLEVGTPQWMDLDFVRIEAL